MSTATAGVPSPAKKAPAAKPAPVIRLDTSRPHGRVSGERQPDDPHYLVHFEQDGLPFDSRGILVPDDGRLKPWNGMVDGKPVVHYPLYTKERREVLAKRQAALARRSAPKAAVPVEEAIPEDYDNAVNLESWLRGEIEYQPFEIFAAHKARFGQNMTKLHDVVEALVFDERIVPQDEVSPEIMANYKPAGRQAA